MGKISVDGFLREYSVAAKQQGSAMETFIKKHIVTDYVDFATKSAYCDSIINATCYIKVGEKKIIKFNSATRYIFFTMKIIELYTDIEINADNLLGDYDKLNKVDAINCLIAGISESEYSEFYTLLNMKLDDLRDNEYCVTALLYNFKESFSLSEDVIKEVLTSPEVKEMIQNIKDNNE